ncbi:hypothetical protein NXH58_00470 [Agathobacter ruminis]|nr:hypothetical protein [Agathobacter ruminis]
MRLAAYQFAECGDIAGSDRINVNVVSEAIKELQKLADELDKNK